MTGLAYIYTLADPRTNEVRYVGKTFNLKQRLYGHMHFRGCWQRNKNSCWIQSLKSNGLKPVIEVLETFPENDVSGFESAEQFWIQTLRFYGCRLTNMDSGGVTGRHRSIETRRLIGEYSKKRVHTPETKAKISRSCKARMTPEVKSKFIASWRGRKHTEETKRQMSLAKKGIHKPAHVLKAMQEGTLRYRLAHGCISEKIRERTEETMKFSKDLKAWRLELGLICKEAASKLNVTYSAYRAWETGLRTPNKMSEPEIRRRMASVQKDSVKESPVPVSTV